MPALPDDLVRIFEGGRLHTAGFLMDRNPVTEAALAALLGGAPAGPDGARRVAQVTWAQAVACCNNDLGFLVRQRNGTDADRNAFRMVVVDVG